MMDRQEFEDKRSRLAELGLPEIRERFWRAAFEIAKPLVEMARTHTTPSIERSVLLRMGFSSVEAQAIVERCVKEGLLPKGVGNVVLRVAQGSGVDVLEAGRRLARGQGWEVAADFFRYPLGESQGDVGEASTHGD